MSQADLFKDLNERQKQLLRNVILEMNEGQPVVNRAGIGIPPFALALLKSIGIPKILNYCVQETLNSKHPEGWGTTVEVGYEEKIGSCNARKAKGDILWRKTGDRS